jgi:hypothetical protein
MAVPTRYDPKRLSDYILRGARPSGARFPSGLVSGRRAGANPYEGANKKLLASFEKAQKAHDITMANIAKAEADRVDRLTKGYTEMLKNAPKDKLGSAIITPEMEVVGEQLKQAMIGGGGQVRGLPTEEQLETIRTEGPGGPGGGAFPKEAPAAVPAAAAPVGTQIGQMKPIKAFLADGRKVEVIGKEGDFLIVIDPARPGEPPMRLPKGAVTREEKARRIEDIGVPF